jgi:hypothetical protein
VGFGGFSGFLAVGWVDELALGCNGTPTRIEYPDAVARCVARVYEYSRRMIVRCFEVEVTTQNVDRRMKRLP